MSEVLFYQLLHRPIERVLPLLLEKTLAKGQRAVVQVGDEARLKILDEALWTYDEKAFLPHNVAEGDHHTDTPIILVDGVANPNGAQVRFCIDVAQLPESLSEERCVFIFDGRLSDALQEARNLWRDAKGAGYKVQYWQEQEDGRFLQPK